MSTPILVYVDLTGVAKRVGTLWTRVRNTRQSATFEYAREWLGDPNRFALEPALAVGPGPHHTPANLPLFGLKVQGSGFRNERMKVTDDACLL